MTDQLPPTEEDVALAAEFLLRILPADEHQAAAARLATDPVFVGLVQSWQEQFATMTESVKPVTPNPKTRTALIAQLFDAPAPTRRWWQMPLVWLGTAAAAIATVAFLALVVPSEPAPMFMAELVSADESLQISALVNPATHTMQLTRTAGAAAPDRSIQVWLIADGQPPISVGVLPSSQTVIFDVPRDLPAPAAELILAISDEPLGGSPTGQPTGAVLAVSTLNRL